jgi:hypothetical protein
VGTIMKNFELKVRLTQYEALQLKQEALRRNMTKSELIRSLIARFPDPLLQKDLLDISLTRSPRFKNTGLSR